MPASGLVFSQRLIRFSLCAFCLALPLTIAGANAAWVILLAGLVIRWAKGGRLPWHAVAGPLAKPLWFYLAVSVLTAILGIAPAHSARYLIQDAHKVWFYLLFSIALAVEANPAGLAWLAIGSVIACVMGIFQTAASLAQTGVWERAHAFVHPVTFGEQAAFALLGSVCFLIEPQSLPTELPRLVIPAKAGIHTRENSLMMDPRLRGGDEQKMVSWGISGLHKISRTKIAVWAMLFLSALALLFSNTQGALLGFVGGLVAIGLLLPQWRRKILLAMPIIFVIVVGILFAIEKLRFGHSLIAELANFGKTGTMSSQGQLMRITLWKVAWRMGLDHPWTGVGFNNYRTAFHQYFSGVLDQNARDWGTAHNLYLHQFAERGILGVAALLWLLVAMWIHTLRRARNAPNAWNLWAYGSVVAFLIMNFTEVALQVEMIWMLVFFIWIWSRAQDQGSA